MTSDRLPFKPISQLPNVLTLMALACGLTAIRIAADHPHSMLILFVMGGAALLDGIDGRIARILDATSEMGAQLDSLCDAIGFGVAPGMITYFLVMRQDMPVEYSRNLITISWLSIIIYVGAIVLRLARFNTLAVNENRPKFTKDFFVGVPAPMAAWLALVPVCISIQYGDGWWSHPLATSIWMVLIAALAFSRLPTFSGKKLKIPAGKVPVILIIALVLIGGLLTFPVYTVLLILVGYVAHIPFAWRAYRWLEAHPEAWEVSGPQRRQMRTEGRVRRIRKRPRVRM